MARLPQPGGDDGNWGEILNEYLSQSLAADGKLKETSVSEFVPKRTAQTGQWHFDVLQGQNDGTVLPFSSRVVDGSGQPVLEQIIAKPTSDVSEGVIDWRHDSGFGDLLHLTMGPSMGAGQQTTGAALIALGLDNGYGTGMFINNKGGTNHSAVGLKIMQNSSINQSTGAYGIEVQQNSSTSTAVHLQQANNAATLMRLQASTVVDSDDTLLLQVIAAGDTKGRIRSKSGEQWWKADIVTHDGAGFVSTASILTTNGNQTKQTSDSFGLRSYSGTAGIFYPGRLARNSGGLRLDVAPNTSSGPNWALSTWQTGLLVKPGSARARVLLGTGSPATTETEGYPYVPVVSGAPTGTPTAETGYAPMVVDASGSRLWVYINGAWRSSALS